MEKPTSLKDFDGSVAWIRDRYEVARLDMPVVHHRGRNSDFYSNAQAVMMRRAYRLAKTTKRETAIAALRAVGKRVSADTTTFHAVLRLILPDQPGRVTKLATELRYAAGYKIHWRYLTIFRQLTGDCEDIKRWDDAMLTVHEEWARDLRRNPRKLAPPKRKPTQ